jgi:hypothetical protein
MTRPILCLALTGLLSATSGGCADPQDPVIYNGFTSSDTDFVSDASDAASGDADASDASGPRCDELQADYTAAVQAAKACTDDTDCQVVGGTGTCDCAHTWGNASGDAVNQSFTLPADWSSRVEACADFIADRSQECDAAPAENPRCDQGTCIASGASCLD